MSQYSIRCASGQHYTLNVTKDIKTKEYTLTCQTKNSITYINDAIDDKTLTRIQKAIANENDFKYKLISNENELTLTITNELCQFIEDIKFIMTEESKKINTDVVYKLAFNANKRLDYLESFVYKKIFTPYDKDSKDKNAFMKLIIEYMTNNITDYKKSINDLMKKSEVKFEKENGVMYCLIKNDEFNCALPAISISDDCLNIMLYIKYLVYSAYVHCPLLNMQETLLSYNSPLLCKHNDILCGKCKFEKTKQLSETCIKHLNSSKNKSCIYKLVMDESYFGLHAGSSILNKLAYYGATEQSKFNNNCCNITQRDVKVLEKLAFYELILNMLSENGYHVNNLEVNSFDEFIKCSYNADIKYNYRIHLLNNVDEQYYDIYTWKKHEIDTEHMMYISDKYVIEWNSITFFKRIVIYRHVMF